MLSPLIAQRTKRIRFMLLEAVLVISDGVEAVLSSAADAPHPAAAFAIAICSASYAVAGVLGALKTWFGLKVIASSLLVERHGHAMCFLLTPGPAAAAAPRRAISAAERRPTVTPPSAWRRLGSRRRLGW